MSAEASVRGSIEVRTYSWSKRVIRLISCPFCEYAFGHNEHRWQHFLDEHGPEDAGLSPLNEPDPELVTDGGRRSLVKAFRGPRDDEFSMTFEDAESCDECGKPNAGVRATDGRALCAKCYRNEADENGGETA